jgi:PhzF family phenazine biosynthesis protein
MHSIARELNFPVTAFLETKGNEKYNIRYFTITGEIPACGHATLASAKVVFELTSGDSVQFETIENINLTAIRKDENIFITYPKFTTVNFDIPENMLKSLEIKHYQPIGFCKELDTLFIELEDPKLLRELQPDYKLLTASTDQVIEVVITSVSDNTDFDFLLRSFCPWIGIDEDPVTGSIHSVLAGFWKNRLGKYELKAYQASQRGGEVIVKASDDKVELGGRAITVVRGELIL